MIELTNQDWHSSSGSDQEKFPRETKILDGGADCLASSFVAGPSGITEIVFLIEEGSGDRVHEIRISVEASVKFSSSIVNWYMTHCRQL
jgi:hypothetical protein